MPIDYKVQSSVSFEECADLSSVGVLGRIRSRLCGMCRVSGSGCRACRGFQNMLATTKVRQGWSNGGITPWTIRLKGKPQPDQDEHADHTTEQAVQLRVTATTHNLTLYPSQM